MSRPVIYSILLVISCVIHHSAFAYEKGDKILRIGIAHVQPNDESTALALNGTELSALPGLNLPRTEVQVEDNTQLGITATYMLTNHWGLELLASSPFQHEIRAEALGVKAGETRHLPPTLNIQYYPMSADSKLQPFAGLGLNYTAFFDEEVDNELNAVLAGLGATGNASLDLDDSWGLAAELGVDYGINEQWLFNATLWYIDIETTAYINAPGLGTLNSDVSIDPWVFMLSAGYMF